MSTRSLLRGIVAAAALLATVALLLPTSLGGATGYVTTHGTSMEPRFHTGDLAVVRTGGDYHVGDVVAYHSTLLSTTVLHRIVAVHDGHYTFQGDNNSWIDPETPTRDQLIGELVLRIPHGGIWLDRASSPTGLALLTLALIVLGSLNTRRSRRTHRKKRNRTVSDHARRPEPPHRGHGRLPRPSRLGLVATTLGVAGLAVGAFAWSGPVTRPATTQEPSDRSVTFSYTATVPRGPAYDDTVVTAPQPVFRALTNSVEVRYQYAGDPGSVAVDAELATTNGWQSTVPLPGYGHFDTTTYDGHVRLDLDALAERAEHAADVIGLPADGLTVTLRPRFTDDTGDVFAPELPLTLTPDQLAPADDASLHVDDSGTVTTTTQQPRTLTVAGHHLTAHAARTIAAVLILLALLTGTLAALAIRMTPPATRAETARRRLAPHLLTVEPVAVPSEHLLVEVSDTATIAAVAERYDLPILHWSRDGIDTFLVHDEVTSYRFRVAAA